MFHDSLVRNCITGVLVGFSANAFAQGISKGKSDGGSHRSSGNDFALSLPLSLYGESVVRLEANLGHQASLALEGTIKRQDEDISEKEAEKSYESLVTNAKGALLLISRYSEPTRLAGFYWALGLGFRTMNADWQVQPDPSDKKADLSLTNRAEDADVDIFHHRATMHGTTGHLRGGYRYVAQELPLMFGAYIGIRHFQASIKDDQVDDGEAANQNDRYATMTERERERLKRRYMTTLEPALELGFIF